MNKNTSTALISIIIILMIITISIVIKISGSVRSTLIGNNTKKTDKNILNTTVAYENTSYNFVRNTASEENQAVVENVTTTNETIFSNNIQNSISVENTIVQNTVVHNEVTPPPAENEIRGMYANTGIIPGLDGSIQQVVITTDDVFESFLTQYNISRNISGITNYMSESFFRTNNLGIIYIPLEEGQTFEVEKQGESGGVLYINLKLNPSYTGEVKTGGMLVLIELGKNTTTLQVTS